MGFCPRFSEENPDVVYDKRFTTPGVGSLGERRQDMAAMYLTYRRDSGSDRQAARSDRQAVFVTVGIFSANMPKRMLAQ